MGFLMNRDMVVRYKGTTSQTMDMPSRSPQGTLLGLILFLILINDCVRLDENNSIAAQVTRPRKHFAPSDSYAKFVDDLTIAESFDISNSEPRVFEKLKQIVKYAGENEMKLNVMKTAFMVFNTTLMYDYEPNLELFGTPIKTVEEMKILGGPGG